MADILKLETSTERGVSFIRDRLREVAEYPIEDLRGSMLLLPEKKLIIGSGNDPMYDCGVLAWAQHVLSKRADGEDVE